MGNSRRGAKKSTGPHSGAGKGQARKEGGERQLKIRHGDWGYKRENKDTTEREGISAKRRRRSRVRTDPKFRTQTGERAASRLVFRKKKTVRKSRVG